MQERHNNQEFYFNEQSRITEQIILPYITLNFPISSDSLIAEIGCGNGGNLLPFLNLGCKATGIDISRSRITDAIKFYANHPIQKNLTLIAEDFFSITPEQTGKFDLIIIRDTLEHIENQELFLSHTKMFLKPDGRIFLGFPPWYMPFGGHQQMCSSKILSKTPYFHLLPKFLFFGVLKLFGEKQYRVEELMKIRSTRISIRKFEKIVARNHLNIEKTDFFLINPIYEIKFNLKPRKLPLILNIPVLRDFFTTTCFYILA
jgi:SAM-dependent methyltransferase